MNPRNRVAMVTGGASGLGRACVDRLRRDGAIVAVVDRAPKGIERLTSDGVTAYQCEIADPAGLELVFNEVRERFGRVSILINCAGIATPGSVVRRGAPMPLEEFRQVVAVNLLGTINAIRCAAAQMIESHAADPAECEHGVIINTSSIAATDGQVGQAAYAASKGGVSALVLPLARELGEYGIRVNAIAPGVFETPMTLALPQKSREVVFAAVPPFPKRPGRPEEFADAVSFLVTQAFINGAVIRLDGGLRMPARY
ncbi:MAG: SDR family oxidoreductase [Proteobacteria bacterium]|nr:SDR family oxidoreductase [Pseudomonadota bacterium]